MVKRTKLATAIKLAALGAAGAAMLSATPVFAQDDLGAIEEVMVTGSRIKRADLESPSPVTVLDREAMKVTGLSDVGDLIQSMPSMSGSPIGTTTNNGGNGSVQIDMRGMGVNRTLTLVNGRRTVDGGDFQTIASTMIDRVEILKDGASAVYGADAVAGVVNIITRRDFDGVEIDVQAADYFNMDSGTQESISLIAGKTFDKGNFVFGAEYVTQEEAYQSDAPWDFFQNSYYVYPNGCEKHPTRPYDGTTAGGCYPAGSSRIVEGRLKVGNQGTFINEGNGLIPDDGRSYNYAPINYIQTPYDRTNFFMEGNFELSDSVRFFTEVRANLRSSAQELAPTPYDSRPGFDPSYSGLFDLDGDGILDSYNGISEDNYYLSQALAAAGLTSEPVTAVRRRMIEAPRRFEQDVTQVQAVFGFEGTVNDYDWQASYNRGYRSRTDRDFGQLFGGNLSKALGPSADLDGDGSPECYIDINNPATKIAGCVPLNLVGGEGTITPQMLSYVSASLTDHTTEELEQLDFSVSGSGFELQGGALGWAIGGGYLGQSLVNSPDSTKQLGVVSGGTGAATEGSLYNTNLFTEILAPVFDNGAQSIDLKAGLRYDAYNQFGSDTTWQLGFEAQLIDSVKVRATAGTVFRAPTINDLYGGVSDNAPTAQDPCATAPIPAGCAQQSTQDDNQLPGSVGGNADLTPETGDTFTAGVVWTPDFGDAGDMSVTVDYWKVDIENGISSLGTQFILDDCYINQNAAACSLVTRTADYTISNVRDTSLNVAEQGAEGVDTEVIYNFSSPIGQWRASAIWTHTLSRTKTPFAGAPEIELAGVYSDPTAEDGGAYAEDKLNYSLTWYMDALSVTYRGEYISSMESDSVTFDANYHQPIDAMLYHDIAANYEFSTGTTLAAGITNITDEEPPYIDKGFNAGTDPATYRLFGTGYYVRLTQKF